SGNAWIQHIWNGDIVNVRNQVKHPENYKFELAKEGTPLGSDTFAIPTNAAHPGTALLFIDWMLDPGHAAKNINWVGYPMPNKGGLPIYGWHPGNYSHVFDPLFAPVLVRSVLYALATVALCLLIGYPVAYTIARFGGRHKNVLIVLIVLPFFVNYLVRTYAWV